jgi:hypothetical protein
MTWSIERLENGWGLVQTNGQNSRTVYVASKAKDAADFLAMAEVYELVKGGAPVEALVKPAKRRTR